MPAASLLPLTNMRTEKRVRRAASGVKQVHHQFRVLAGLQVQGNPPSPGDLALWWRGCGLVSLRGLGHGDYSRSWRLGLVLHHHQLITNSENVVTK